ncbi:uncharacterized protein LOC128873605 [Hylaeus volcanicus]|uniref:uncharacterized protein LOC128873605 n=1 Tax=Hylaeus volcanicus TaxID=313075 RepID=UPI0023B87708|nr:uncharacterized protein LOC128873605 [Hylaeus volcanicus]
MEIARLDETGEKSGRKVVEERGGRKKERKSVATERRSRGIARRRGPAEGEKWEREVKEKEVYQLEPREFVGRLPAFTVPLLCRSFCPFLFTGIEQAYTAARIHTGVPVSSRVTSSIDKSTQTGKLNRWRKAYSTSKKHQRHQLRNSPGA